MGEHEKSDGDIGIMNAWREHHSQLLIRSLIETGTALTQ